MPHSSSSSLDAVRSLLSGSPLEHHPGGTFLPDHCSDFAVSVPQRRGGHISAVACALNGKLNRGTLVPSHFMGTKQTPHQPPPLSARILRQSQAPRARTAAPATLAERFWYVLPEGRDGSCATGTPPASHRTDPSHPNSAAKSLACCFPLSPDNHHMHGGIHAWGHLSVHGGTHTQSGFAFRVSAQFFDVTPSLQVNSTKGAAHLTASCQGSTPCSVGPQV